MFTIEIMVQNLAEFCLGKQKSILEGSNILSPMP